LRTFLLPFVRHFRGKGWRVDGAASELSRDAGCGATFDRVWDVGWSRNPRDPRNILVAPGQIRALVRQERYDIVHVTTPVASFVTRLALRAPGVGHAPVVVYSAHGFHFHAQGKAAANAAFLLLEKCASFHDFLVVTNREDEVAALMHRLAPPGRVIYIPGVGVDAADEYNPEHTSADEIQRIRRGLQLAPTTPLFVMVAEFNPGKRHRDAIEAIATVSRSTDAHLALTGDGPLRDEMQALAVRLGVADRTHFLGFVEGLKALVQSSLAMVLPSIREGLPRSVMEALSLGVPCIGYDIRGVSELLEDGCGLVCQPRDVSGLAQAMLRLIGAPEEARAMGARGRRKILSKYTLEHVLAAHERLYNAALAAHRRTRGSHRVRGRPSSYGRDVGGASP
jgi:glycosyltransferase involved in cell wall biosynthesis